MLCTWNLHPRVCNFSAHHAMTQLHGSFFSHPVSERKTCSNTALRRSTLGSISSNPVGAAPNRAARRSPRGWAPRRPDRAVPAAAAVVQERWEALFCTSRVDSAAARAAGGLGRPPGGRRGAEWRWAWVAPRSAASPTGLGVSVAGQSARTARETRRFFVTFVCSPARQLRVATHGAPLGGSGAPREAPPEFISKPIKVKYMNASKACQEHR